MKTTQVASGISQFARQNTAQMIVNVILFLYLPNKLFNTGVNFAESNSNVICNSKAITVRGFDIN